MIRAWTALRFTASSSQQRVVEYYDGLAHRYELDRFSNSYGAYVNAQERRILRHWLAPVRHGNILDLACGTGRLLDLATHGLDASQAMVRIARSKHPGKTVYCGPAIEMDRFGVQFDAIFCLQLFMHLSVGDIESLIRACVANSFWGAVHLRRADRSPAKADGLSSLGMARGYDPESGGGSELFRRWLAAPLNQGCLFFPVHRLPLRVRRPSGGKTISSA